MAGSIEGAVARGGAGPADYLGAFRARRDALLAKLRNGQLDLDEIAALSGGDEARAAAAAAATHIPRELRAFVRKEL